MKIEIKGKQLVITLDMEETRNPSTSGKTGVIDPVSDKEITIGVNAYVKAD